MGNQLTLSDRYHIAKRKVVNKVKAALVNDVPPGVPYKKGGEIPTLAALKAFSERYSLASLLPYEAYDEENGLYFNRDTVGFMLYANPATGLSPTELKTLNGFFNQSHKADTTIQVGIISDPNIEPILNRWKATKGNVDDPKNAEIFRTIAEGRVKYLKEGKWDSLLSDQAFLVRNYHLVISYTIPIPKGMEAIDVGNDDIERLVRTREATIGTLRSAKIFAQSMGPNLFINILNGFLNPSRAPQPALKYDDNNLISRQIVDADTLALFESGASSLIHKDEAFTVLPYHVRQFPQKWAGYKNGNLVGSFTNNILRLSCPFIATLTVHATDQLSAKGKVTRKSVRATQMADSPLAKYVPQWKERKVDWDYTAEKIDNGNKLLEAFYQVILLAPQGREQECEQSLRSTYDALGWVLSKTRYSPVHSLMGALPMGLCQETKRALQLFGHFSTRLSWTCTNVAPWMGEWKGTATPMMMLQGRRGQLCFFDPFDNDKGNYNISCSATSGSGKSVFTQEWIFSCLGNDGRAFVIDVGGSYKNLCNLLNGTYLDFSTGTGKRIGLNPFSSISGEDPKYFREQMPMLKMLIGQMAGSERALSQKQKSVLEKAIMRTWQQFGSSSTITKVVETLKADSTDDGPMHSTAKDLAIMLFSYTKEGMYGDYFEGPANIDLDNPFVVLDLSALTATPDLQSVVLLILMMRITQVMYLSGNRSQRKLCIIDEAWRLLGSGSSGDFIEEGYRVARKHGGSFMTITQKISDYYKSETAKAAYANSDFKVYLRQDLAELAEAEALGHISNSSGKVDVIRSLETVQGKYSELAIDSPDGLSVVRFSIDRISEKLYSTSPKEVDFIQAAEARGVHIFDAVNELIANSESR